MAAMSERIYLDYNAGAPLVPAARAAMLAALAQDGNPSSLHEEGRRARQLVERARNQVAALLGAPREELVFTSGGTEADQLGILGLAQRAAAQGRPRRVAVSAIDHPAVHGAIAYLVRALGWERIELPVSEHGLLRVPEPAPSLGLVVASWVNHELGVVQDLAALAGFAERAGALLFIDAVQAAGKLPLSEALRHRALGALAISSHKLGGPKGAGALWLRPDPVEALPVIEGGHQERGRRPGTEDPIALAGFGAAAAAADLEAWTRTRALADAFEQRLLALGAIITGVAAPRAGGTINARFSGAPGQELAMALDLHGISVSTGAACTSGTLKPSPVLLALGLAPDEARQALRFSLGPATTAAMIDTVAAALPELLARVRQFAR